LPLAVHVESPASNSYFYCPVPASTDCGIKNLVRKYHGCSGCIELCTVLQMPDSFSHNNTQLMLKTCHFSTNFKFSLYDFN
jgi:hypothetical protein